ncbi:MAG TPA: hypothetical protein VEL47_05890, partial [Myxococcota bacterium]|nr:hypothetical protein [Myxococcota bacterium]
FRETRNLNHNRLSELINTPNHKNFPLKRTAPESTILRFAAALGDYEGASMIIDSYIWQHEDITSDLKAAYWIAYSSRFQVGIHRLIKEKSDVDPSDLEFVCRKLFEISFYEACNPGLIAVCIDSMITNKQVDGEIAKKALYKCLEQIHNQLEQERKKNQMNRKVLLKELLSNVRVLDLFVYIGLMDYHKTQFTFEKPLLPLPNVSAVLAELRQPPPRPSNYYINGFDFGYSF